MRPDEPYIHEPDREFDYGDQAEIVSFDIEHITLVAYIINAIESLFTSAKQLHSLFLTFCTQSCKATFDSGCRSAYSLMACSVKILIALRAYINYDANIRRKFHFTKYSFILQNNGTIYGGKNQMYKRRAATER